jgi:hypothetical protein
MSARARMWPHNSRVDPLTETAFELLLELSNTGQLTLRHCAIITIPMGVYGA